MPDALDKLLIEKYGVLPDQVPSLKEAVLRGDKSITGANEIKGEALSSVADDQINRMNELRYLAGLAELHKRGTKTMGPELAADYQKYIDNSRANTRKQAQELADYEELQKYGIADRELNRMNNMNEYAAGIKDLGNGAYQTNFAPPGDFRSLVPFNGPATVVPVQPQPSAPARASGDAQKGAGLQSYVEKLNRAYAARQALLGH